MRLKMIFSFLIFNLVLFFAYAENIIYKVDDGFTDAAGATVNPAVHLIVHVYFSFECEVEKWNKRLQAAIAREYLSMEIMYYVNKTFPNHTLAELVGIMRDEENTLFFDGFVEHIRNNEGLSNVRITSLRMEPRFLPVVSTY